MSRSLEERWALDIVLSSIIFSWFKKQLDLAITKGLPDPYLMLQLFSLSICCHFSCRQLQTRQQLLQPHPSHCHQRYLQGCPRSYRQACLTTVEKPAPCHRTSEHCCKKPACSHQVELPAKTMTQTSFNRCLLRQVLVVVGTLFVIWRWKTCCITCQLRNCSQQRLLLARLLHRPHHILHHLRSCLLLLPRK